MTQINVLIRPVRPGELKTVGKVLFLAGVGFLTFSATCLFFFKDFCSHHASAILTSLLASLALVLGGESLVALALHLDPAAARGKAVFRWMTEPVNKPGKKMARECSFCGAAFQLPPVSESEDEAAEREFDRMIFGVCLGCGRTVCPKCASVLGPERRTISNLCPGCGSLVL